MKHIHPFNCPCCDKLKPKGMWRKFNDSTEIICHWCHLLLLKANTNSLNGLNAYREFIRSAANQRGN